MASGRPTNPPPTPRTSRRPIRPGPVTRLAAWYVTGPLGHLVAGALDIGELLARYLWLRARGRHIEWF